MSIIPNDILKQLVDERDWLRAEVERLREALKQIVEMAKGGPTSHIAATAHIALYPRRPGLPSGLPSDGAYGERPANTGGQATTIQVENAWELARRRTPGDGS